MNLTNPLNFYAFKNSCKKISKSFFLIVHEHIENIRTLFFIVNRDSRIKLFTIFNLTF